MKPLLVVSTGRCVWDDVAKVQKMTEDYDTLSVSHMVMFWPEHLNYAVSWHPPVLAPMVDIRTFRNHRNRPLTYGPRACPGIDHVGRFYDGNVETSGMYGAVVGLYMGYEKIILAGVPFDSTGHFYDPPDRESKEFKYRYPASKSWDELRDNANDRIRPVSGDLTKCFGELTEEWLTV